MRTIIQGGTIVNEDKTFDGSIVIEDSKISEIVEGNTSPEVSVDEVIDASGCFILPGIIDDHVHFREPGLTEKADMESESLSNSTNIAYLVSSCLWVVLRVICS